MVEQETQEPDTKHDAARRKRGKLAKSNASIICDARGLVNRAKPSRLTPLRKIIHYASVSDTAHWFP
jgi:hypothetical protein